MDNSPYELTFESKLEVEGDIVNIRQRINNQLYKITIDTTEKQIRAGLIALGWTPPYEDGNGVRGGKSGGDKAGNTD